eukprot:m.221463 g.221463  ORF g.221463 m.221463 type:complete len:658 (-) comp33349_c0_seq1:81-2054(-)
MAVKLILAIVLQLVMLQIVYTQTTSSQLGGGDNATATTVSPTPTVDNVDQVTQNETSSTVDVTMATTQSNANITDSNCTDGSCTTTMATSANDTMSTTLSPLLTTQQGPSPQPTTSQPTSSPTTASPTSTPTTSTPSTSPSIAPTNPRVKAVGNTLQVLLATELMLAVGSGNQSAVESVTNVNNVVSTSAGRSASSYGIAFDVTANLTQALDTIKRTNDFTEKKIALYMACANQNKLFVNGKCIRPVSTCEPLPTLPPNMTVSFDPPGMGHEHVPGVLATFVCENGFIDPNVAKVYCRSNGRWNRPTPSGCGSCERFDKRCTECGNSVCSKCTPHYVLNANNTQCLPLGSSKLSSARDCDELSDAGFASGAYWIRGNAPWEQAARVYCDQLTDGGGWTLLSTFQKDTSNSLLMQPEYANVLGNMWIEGCGHTGSIACFSRGPDIPGYRFDGDTMRSLDWREMLNQGEKYQLRVTLARGQENFTASELEGGVPFMMYSYGAVDAAYTFTYPGFVTQDTNGGGEAPEDLVWNLTDVNRYIDTTGVRWSNGYSSTSSSAFYPPWSKSKTGFIVNGCNGYNYGRVTDRTCGYITNSAGIINMDKLQGKNDPVGAAYFPYYPAYSRACLIWAPHQYGVRGLSHYCGKTYLVGGYWFRKSQSL